MSAQVPEVDQDLAVTDSLVQDLRQGPAEEVGTAREVPRRAGVSTKFPQGLAFAPEASKGAVAASAETSRVVAVALNQCVALLPPPGDPATLGWSFSADLPLVPQDLVINPLTLPYDLL